MALVRRSALQSLQTQEGRRSPSGRRPSVRVPAL